MTIANLEPVSPVQPAAGYIGGKRNLAKRICAIIDATDHTGYAEPFVGMGGIFLRRTARPKVEAINDISGDVANFFRVLQEHYPYFIDMLRFRIASRNEFERLKGQDPEKLTDLQRAARFLYLQRLAFGGKVAGRNFGVSFDRAAPFSVTKLEPILADLHDRLQGVWIEQLTFEQFVSRYDRPGMLFYCDPPYFGCEDDYGAGVFSRADFERLAKVLSAAAGKVIVSINDTPQIRKVFSNFRQTEASTTYSISGKRASAGNAAELIISNFELPIGADG